MNYIEVLLMVLVLLTGAMGNAQSIKVVEDCKPSEVNQQGKSYPQVNSERGVRVQIGAFREMLNEQKIKHVFYESEETGHHWLTWRRCLYQYAQLLFK